MNDKDTAGQLDRSAMPPRDVAIQGSDLGDIAGDKAVTGGQVEQQPLQLAKNDTKGGLTEEDVDNAKGKAKEKAEPAAPVVALRGMVLYWALPEDVQHGIEAESDLVGIIVKVNADDTVNLRVFAHDSAVEVFKAGVTQGHGMGQFRF